MGLTCSEQVLGTDIKRSIAHACGLIHIAQSSELCKCIYPVCPIMLWSPVALGSVDDGHYKPNMISNPQDTYRE